MSSTLHWRPVNPAENDLPFAVKKALAPKYWEHDGSLAGEPRQLDSADLDYLRGLRDGGVAEIQAVIDAIEDHGVIELFWRL